MWCEFSGQPSQSGGKRKGIVLICLTCEKYWGEVGKGKKVDVYLEVRKRRGHIFFEWNKYLWSTTHWSIPTGPPSDELDKNSQRTWLSENFSHWNGYSHFRSGFNWFRKKKCFKNQMSVIWSWTYFYNLVRWLFLSNSSEGGPVGILQCGSRKEKYRGSITI
jgi:hypothetical protein